MENPKTSEWVTPKLVVKRRRKTTSARPEKIERTIDSCLEKENVNNPKFNPFQSKAKTTRRQSTIGFGSIVNEKDENAESEFMEALSDRGTYVTKGLEAKTTNKTMEQRLKERISQGQSHQRKKALDDTPRMDDDCARDGFFPQQQTKKLPLPTLDLSIKQTMKIHLKDTSSFRRIKSVDWARAAAQIKPETDVQELTTASTYYIWPTKLTESVYPRYGRNDFIKGTPEYESEWIQFQQTISSLFSALKFGIHNYFYVFASNFSALIFRSSCSPSDDSPNSTQTSLPGVRLEALITPISTGLRERLIKEGVIDSNEKTENDEKELKLDSMNSKSQPAKSREDYEDILDVDDNQSWDALRAKGIIDFKTRRMKDTKFHGSEQEENTVHLNDKPSVQNFINFLMTLQDNRELPPTVISHLAFCNSSVRHLQVKTTSDTIVISGPIIPHHTYNINCAIKTSILRKCLTEYDVEFTTERATVGFNQFPGCEKRFTSDEEVSINMWLESAPKTVRKVRFKTDHYTVNDN